MDEQIKTGQPMDDTQEYTFAKDSSREPKMIPFYIHEESMLLKDTDNERAHKTTWIVCFAFVLIVIIFVAAYTIRTSIWLDTISKLNAAIVELANAKGIISP